MWSAICKRQIVLKAHLRDDVDQIDIPCLTNNRVQTIPWRRDCSFAPNPWNSGTKLTTWYIIYNSLVWGSLSWPQETPRLHIHKTSVIMSMIILTPMHMGRTTYYLQAKVMHTHCKTYRLALLYLVSLV